MPPVRDKRYTEPELFVDLFELTFKVNSWSREGLVVPLDGTEFASDQVFSGVLTFDNWDDAHGLFNAKITEMHRAEGFAVASFTWVDRHGQALFDRIDEAKKTGTPIALPRLHLSIARRTRNWSLSGLLLHHDGRVITHDGPLFGIIRAEKAADPAFFRAAVIRADPSFGLALKFVSIADATFRVLENVMKKRPTISA